MLCKNEISCFTLSRAMEEISRKKSLLNNAVLSYMQNFQIYFSSKLVLIMFSHYSSSSLCRDYGKEKKMLKY